MALTLALSLLALLILALLALLILSGLLTLALSLSLTLGLLLSLTLALALTRLILGSLLVLTLTLLTPALGGLVGRLIDGAVQFIVRKAKGLRVVAQHAGGGLFDAVAKIVDAGLGAAAGLHRRGAIAGPQHLAGEIEGAGALGGVLVLQGAIEGTAR